MKKLSKCNAYMISLRHFSDVALWRVDDLMSHTAPSEGGKKLYAERLSCSAWARTFRRIMEENHL
jgi:hypothetical protein